MPATDNNLQIATTSAEDVVTITNLIHTHLATIDQSQKELSTQKAMLKDSYENDPTYHEQNEKVKEATKVRNATKNQILQQPALKELSEKVKDLSATLKDSKEALSSYLQEYQRLTGQNSFETPDGEVRQIIYTAKLVKVGK